jgi:maleylacetoacetate isomerase
MAAADSPNAKKAKHTVELYSYFRSSCSWRVRIALNLKGISYDYKAVHLLQDGGQQHSPDYVKINSMHQVPTLIIDGNTLCQSMAIIQYLDETRPEPPLMPEGALARSKCRQLCDIITADIQPVQNLRVLNKHAGADAAAKTEWARFWIDHGFKGLVCTPLWLAWKM